MRVLLCLLVGLTLPLVSCSRPVSPPGVALPAPKPRPSLPAKQLGDPGRVGVAGPVDPDPRVGAVFFDGGTRHSCTASVVHSKGGDLVLTAAHCLSGGLQAEFVPGFAGNAADMWTLVELYFDPRWLASKDPHADYAVARVSGAVGGSLESHVGLALTLATAPAVGSQVSVMGYPGGVGGLPIGCQASTALTDERVSLVAVRRTGRRHQRRALGQRFRGHRVDRWPRAWWVRGKRVVLGAVRRAHRRAAGPRRGRRPRRQRADRLGDPC